MNKIISLGGDAFLAREITAVERVENTVSVYLRQFTSKDDDRFDYEFACEDEAGLSQVRFVSEWKEAIA